ncbi:MAG: hypothetical protein F4073_06860 [Rhodobacteraceae bacterium]|nr:hypothetical protein [Paracoccaceae bacterium]MYF45332.1 hypothetical protein [Paracoccaceae bacterium]MYI91656.1 hypothetical protein [Paracoccaceae bacterium]
MTGTLYLTGISILLFSIAVSRLAVSGAKRLEGAEIVNLPVMFAITLVGCTVGGIFGLLVIGDLYHSGLIHLVLILFFGLLTAGAILDYWTHWAPLELQIPTSFCLGILGWSCTNPTFGEIMVNGTLGLVMLGVVHFLWLIQFRFNMGILPPMDILAALVPIVLFGGTEKTLMLYAILVVVLCCFWIWFRYNRSLRMPMGKEQTSIPFLAVVFPLILGFIFWAVWYDGYF